MAAAFFEAPDVEEIAERLIPQFHRHLDDPHVQIRYLFRDVATKAGGKIVQGEAKKITGLNAKLAGSDDPLFAIVIAYDEWGQMRKEAREALVDHELCHLWFQMVQKREDEPPGPEWSILEHDVEEFKAIVERHGAWNRDLSQFLRVAAKTGQVEMAVETLGEHAGRAA